MRGVGWPTWKSRIAAFVVLLGGSVVVQHHVWPGVRFWAFATGWFACATAFRLWRR